MRDYYTNIGFGLAARAATDTELTTEETTAQ